MSRRSNGEGSVIQRSDGRWQGSVQIGGQREHVYSATRLQAVEKLGKLKEQAQSTGRLPTAKNLTVSDYLLEWLQGANSRLRPTTLADYGVITRLHVSPVLGETRLSRISPLQLSRFYSSLSYRLSPRRVAMVHEFLRKALGDAVRYGLISSNPAMMVNKPKRRPVELNLWTPEQVRWFLAAMHEGQGGWYGNLLIFLLASGCRIGEALGLKWADIDFARGTVRIERQIVQIGKEFIESAPKTRSGVRTFTLPNFGLVTLQRQKAQIAERRLRYGLGWTISDQVFLAEVGTTPGRSNITRSLHQACARLELPTIRVHDLRHINLSLLAMNGVPLKMAQARAGHSSPTTTLQVYSHILGDADPMAAQAIQDALVDTQAARTSWAQ